jgi:hypothetical protein
LVEIVPILIKGSMPTAAAAAAATTTTKQNVNPAVYFVYSRVKSKPLEKSLAGKKRFFSLVFSLIFNKCFLLFFSR